MNVRLDTSPEMVLQALNVADEPGVLATIVTTAGSTYRKSGARMLIRPDGSYVGLLSGGCLETDLSGHASKVQKDHAPRSIEYDMRGPDDLLYGIGAGCEGAMRVLLEPAGAGHPAANALSMVAPQISAGQPAVLIVVHESAHLALGTYAPGAPRTEELLPPPLLAAAQAAIGAAASRSIELDFAQGRTRALINYIAASPHLLVCGAGPDAEPVVGAACTLGWRISVVDHRPALAQAARFPGARVILGDAAQLCELINPADCHAAIVMSHHLASDTAYLRSLAKASAPGFIGLLGPAARRRRLAAEMGALTERLRGRLRGPVGLNIGAVTPEGIALAIIAQIHAWLAEPHRSTGANFPVF